MANILIVDDDLDICETLSLSGKGRGHNIVCVCDEEEADTLVNSGDFRPDAIVVDIRLARGDGLNVLRNLRAKGVEGFAIVFSSFIKTTDLAEWDKLKIFDSLLKPASMDSIWSKIEAAAVFTQEEGSLCDFLRGLIRSNEEVILNSSLVSA